MTVYSNIAPGFRELFLEIKIFITMGTLTKTLLNGRGGHEGVAKKANVVR